MWATPETCQGHIWVRYLDDPKKVVLSVLRITLMWVTCGFCREGRWMT